MSPAHCKPLPFVPVMLPEELPEKKLEYTRESLAKFKDETAAREMAAKLAAASGGDGGFFGGFGGDDDEGKKEEGEKEAVDDAKTKIEVCCSMGTGLYI